MFGRALALLRSHPSLAIPGLVVALVLAVVQVASTPADPLDDDLGRRTLRSIVHVFATIVSIAYTTGMAEAAWHDGRASVADGARAVRRSGGRVLVAAIALFAIGVVAAVLAPFTFGLAFLVYSFFCIYAMPSALAGDRSGIRAVAESAQIALRRPLPTLGVVAAVAVAATVVDSLAEPIAGTPVLGPLLADVVVQFVVAYAALVVVGEYRMLRATGVPA
jgi:hypothetical protein